MKVAFIPPRGMLDYAKRGDMIMCLAQELDNPEYCEGMHRLSSNMFTILDNGANEGQILTHEELFKASEKVHVNEIVLPDVLGSAEETYTIASAYLKVYRRPDMQYMGVVQGENYDELYELIEKYAKVPAVTTLGVPRLLIGRMHQSARLNVATWIEETYPRRFEVHFLGASTNWLKEPYYVNKYELRVRSIDTSLPFNYGLAGEQLQSSEGVSRRKIDRQSDYFTKLHTVGGLTNVMHNMAIYKGWCNGKTSPSS